MKRLFIALCFCSLFVTVIRADDTNVLFIIADDLGVDVLNGYGIGDDLPNTPNIDALRVSGVSFTNTWAAPVCAASRASLITGKYGVNNGVNTLPGHLSTTHKTIFTQIKELKPNYSTCLLGKWHLSKSSNYNHPIAHGVGEYMGVFGSSVSDYYNWAKVEDGVQDTCTEYVTSYLTDYAIDWIKTQNQPWFMWLAHVAPHTPYHNVPEGMSSSTSNGSVKQQFKTMIESLDYEIGRLLDSIPADVLANTVVMFLGDNGTSGNVLQGYPDKHGKQTLYEGGIRVPFIASGKGVTRSGVEENALVNISDFYVSIAQMVDANAFPEDTAFDGVSFKHLLDGTEGEVRSFNYMELGSNGNIPDDIYTVSDSVYKVLDLGSQGCEMYNLATDELEENDLLLSDLTAEQIAIKQKLIAQMDSIRGYSNTPDTVPPVDNVKVGIGNYKIVHTGVSEFYDEDEVIATPSMNEDLYWQDAGRVINEPSYTDNGDGTVTDEVTGLMWQQNMGDKMTYAQAVSVVSESAFAGYDDWRIPTIKELYSLILFSGRVYGESADTHFIDVNYFDQPIGDTSLDEREIDAQTWSSTHYTGLTMNGDSTIFGVNFVDGRIKGYAKYKKATGAANTMYFRMVRANVDYGVNSYNDNNNGTVTDSATALMWQQADDGIARDWMTSISYCEALSLGNYDDWHLPTAKELHSILDYSRSPDATNSAAIDPIFSVTSIADAEGNPGQYPYFWTTSPHKDGPTPYSSAVYIAFGEAMGQMNSTLLDVHGAGAQRSDPKAGAESDYPKYHGPQGDVQRVYNHCRCVRNLAEASHVDDVVVDEFLMTLYPNPTTGLINILATEDISSLKIIDYMGRLVTHMTNVGELSVFDASGLDAGVYLVVAELGGVVQQQVFIKK